jgi:hypothetical protein
MNDDNVGVASMQFGAMGAFMDNGAYPEPELTAAYQEGGVKVEVHRIRRSGNKAAAAKPSVAKVSTAKALTASTDLRGSEDIADSEAEELSGHARSLLEHGTNKKPDHRFGKAAANLGSRAAKAAKAALARAGKTHGPHAQDSSGRVSRTALGKLEGTPGYKAAHKAALKAAHAAGRVAAAASGAPVTTAPGAAVAKPSAAVSAAPLAVGPAAGVERVLAEDEAAAGVVSVAKKPVLAKAYVSSEPQVQLQEAKQQQQQQQEQVQEGKQQQQQDVEEEVEVMEVVEEEVEEVEEEQQEAPQKDAKSLAQQAKEQTTAAATLDSHTAQQVAQVAPQQPQAASTSDKAPHAAGVELVFGKPVGGKALVLPDQLVLLKADGTAVPQEVVAAFRYIWQLLQGRLMMGDPSTLIYFQPNWAGGWLVEHPSSQPGGSSL